MPSKRFLKILLDLKCTPIANTDRSSWAFNYIAGNIYSKEKDKFLRSQLDKFNPHKLGCSYCIWKQIFIFLFMYRVLPTRKQSKSTFLQQRRTTAIIILCLCNLLLKKDKKILRGIMRHQISDSKDAFFKIFARIKITENVKSTGFIFLYSFHQHFETVGLVVFISCS